MRGKSRTAQLENIARQVIDLDPRDPHLHLKLARLKVLSRAVFVTTSRHPKVEAAERFAKAMRPHVEAAQKGGCTVLRDYVAYFQAHGIKTVSGGDNWSAVTVSDLLKRVGVPDRLP